MLKLYYGRITGPHNMPFVKISLVCEEEEERNIHVVWPGRLVLNQWEGDVQIGICGFYNEDAEVWIKHDRFPELSPIYGKTGVRLIRVQKKED